MANFFSTHTLGIASVLVVVLCWLASGFISKSILLEYSSPYFMSFFTNLSFMIFFIFLVIDDPVNRLIKRKLTDLEAEQERESRLSVKIKKLPPFTTPQIALIAFPFFVLYLIANYTTNASFEHTAVSSAAILASTCGLFTLIFGWILGVEVLSVLRIVAVLVSVGGVVALGLPSFYSEGNTFLGNIMALIGAVMYGVYSIYLKRATVDESRVHMPLLFAFAGLYTLLFAWPVFFLLHYTHFEPFHLPTPSMALRIFINIVVGGLIPSYFWNVAFVCTSPLIVAIGISFNIPLTLLVEYLIEGVAPGWDKIAGGLCVIIGFALVNISSLYPAVDMWAERMVCVRTGLMREDEVQSPQERVDVLQERLVDEEISKLGI